MTEGIPRCIGIILDGNRRWAKERGLSSAEGHQAGAQNVKPIVNAAFARGIEHVVLYGFSTENWRRSDEEVSALMHLLAYWIEASLNELIEKNVRVRFIGELGRFSEELRTSMRSMEEKTSMGTSTLWLCVSYGSRAEILDAAKKLHESGEAFTEESLREKFWSAGMPDPDMTI